MLFFERSTCGIGKIPRLQQSQMYQKQTNIVSLGRGRGCVLGIMVEILRRL